MLLNPHTTVTPVRRSRPRLLAAGLAAAALFGASAGTGDALAASCPGASVSPARATQGELARATLCLVNVRRRSRDLPSLRMNGRLSDAARRHSSDMVRRQYFEHTAPGGTTFLKRIRRTGYLRSARHWLVGENIGWGAGSDGSAREIVQAWMHSPPHRKAILTRRYREAGIGVALGAPTPDASQGATYTLDFGVKN
jgi:uncharacterized protein YkwD